MDNDIALIKLKGKIKFSAKVKPICLPHQDFDFGLNSDCYVAGWGAMTEGGTDSEELREVKVSLRYFLYADKFDLVKTNM